MIVQVLDYNKHTKIRKGWYRQAVEVVLQVTPSVEKVDLIVDSASYTYSFEDFKTGMQINILSDDGRTLDGFRG